MITSIAKFSKSIILKVFVGIIILPFVFWGMGSVFRGGSQNIIVKIDNEKISTQEFANYVNRLNLEPSDRKNIGATDLIEKILSDYIGKKVVEYEINDLGILLTDKSLKKIITEDETFYKEKEFSRLKYEKFLLENNLSAPLFEQNIASQEKKRQFLSMLSGGFRVPSFLIDNEFKKENQVKNLTYLQINKIFENQTFPEKEKEKIYNDNKKFLTNMKKDIEIAELNSELLTGSKEVNKNFFEKIDLIENQILDGMTFEEIVKENDLKIKQFKNINLRKINKNEFSIPKNLLKKIYISEKMKSPKLLKEKNIFYLTVIQKEIENIKDISDKDVQDFIKARLILQKKIELSNKISNEISSGQFNLNKMSDLSKQYNIQLIDASIKGLKDNKIFTENLIRKIFLLSDKSFSLVADTSSNEIFLIYIKKTIFKDIKLKEKEIQKYKSRTKLLFANEVFSKYDNSLNTKYKVDINQSAVDRIKNSF